MTVELGTPPTLRLDLLYQDPVDLFPRLDGTLIFPVWVTASNISTQPATLTIGDLRLTLGSQIGAPANLTPIDPRQAEQQLRSDVRMNAVVGAIARQGGVLGAQPVYPLPARWPDRSRPVAERATSSFSARPASSSTAS